VRTALAYRPGPGRLQRAAVTSSIAFVGAFVVLAFTYSNPIVLCAIGLAVAVAGTAAGARDAVVVSLRWGAALAVVVVGVNALVTHRGETILVRGWDVPVLGQLDVTLESIVAGGVIALRILVVVMAFAVYSACVDPDRVLRLLRPVAGRSALTATLISRLVPLAASDHVRLREAAELRGPGAAPAGRSALARRLVAGSLDRAVEVAATLELRGYAGPARASTGRVRRSRYDLRFLATGLVVVAAGVAARLAGAGGFEAYPSLAVDAGAATLLLAVTLPLAAWLPFAGQRSRVGRRRRRRRQVTAADGVRGAGAGA
jgi:energy-coupling factor transport system permease protein